MTEISIKSMSAQARQAWGLCGECELDESIVHLADDGRVFWGSFWIGTLRPDQIARAKRELRLPLTT